MLITAVSTFFYANFETVSFSNIFWLIYLLIGYIIILPELVVRNCGFYVVNMYCYYIYVSVNKLISVILIRVLLLLVSS